MRGLILALQFLTRLPTPSLRDFRQEELAHAAAWFPLVGLIVGGVLALVWSAAARFDPWLAGLVGLIAWVWLTGGLHLDGLADLFDALGASHRDRERFLAVLADPHLGSFGALALMLQLLAKLVLLMLLAGSLPARPEAWLGLLLIPAWARLGALWWSQTLPPLKPGLAERFAWRAGAWLPWAWAAALMLLSARWAPALLGAPLALLGWRLFLHHKVGGMSGDCLGAGVEVTEAMLLLLMLTEIG